MNTVERNLAQWLPDQDLETLLKLQLLLACQYDARGLGVAAEQATEAVRTLEAILQVQRWARARGN